MISGCPTRSNWRRWASHLTRYASSSTWDTKSPPTRAWILCRDSILRRRNIGATLSASKLIPAPVSAWAPVTDAITERQSDSDAPRHVHADLRQAGTAASRPARSDGIRRSGSYRDLRGARALQLHRPAAHPTDRQLVSQHRSDVPLHALAYAPRRRLGTRRREAHQHCVG